MSPIQTKETMDMVDNSGFSNMYNSNRKGDKTKDLNSFIENELSQLALPSNKKA